MKRQKPQDEKKDKKVSKEVRTSVTKSVTVSETFKEPGQITDADSDNGEAPKFPLLSSFPDMPDFFSMPSTSGTSSQAGPSQPPITPLEVEVETDFESIEALSPIRKMNVFAFDPNIKSDRIEDQLRFKTDESAVIEKQMQVLPPIGAAANKSLGEIVTITLVHVKNVYELELRLIPFIDRTFIELKDTELASKLPLKELLSKVRLLIVKPEEVIRRKPGMSFLFVENFDVKLEKNAYIVVHLPPRYDYWVIQQIMKCCKNLQAIIAPYSVCDFSKISFSRIKYLSTKSGSMFENVSSLVEKFPKLMILEYFNASRNCHTYLIENTDPEIKVRDEITKWMRDTLTKEISCILTSKLDISSYPFKNTLIWQDTNLSTPISHKVLTNSTNSRKKFYTDVIMFFDFTITTRSYKIVPHNLRRLYFNTKRTEMGSHGFIGLINSLFQFSNDIRFMTFQLSDLVIHDALPTILERLQKYCNTLTGLKISGFSDSLHDYSSMKNYEIDLDLSIFTELEDFSFQYIRGIKLGSIGLCARLDSLSLGLMPLELVNGPNIKDFQFHFTGNESSDNINNVISFIKTILELKRFTLYGPLINLNLHQMKELYFYFCNKSSLEMITIKESSPREKIESKFITHDAIKTSIARRLELLCWHFPTFPCRLTLDNEYLFLTVTSDGFIAIEENGFYSVHMIYTGGNEIILGNDNSNRIKYLSVDSLTMFNKLSSLMKQLHAVYVVTITTSSSNQLQREQTYMNVSYVLLAGYMPQFRIFRGEISQQFLIQFLDTKIQYSKEIEIYITGSSNEINDELYKKLIKIVFIGVNSSSSLILTEFICPWFRKVDQQSIIVTLDLLKERAILDSS